MGWHGPTGGGGGEGGGEEEPHLSSNTHLASWLVELTNRAYMNPIIKAIGEILTICLLAYSARQKESKSICWLHCFDLGPSFSAGFCSISTLSPPMRLPRASSYCGMRRPQSMQVGHHGVGDRWSFLATAGLRQHGSFYYYCERYFLEAAWRGDELPRNDANGLYKPCGK